MPAEVRKSMELWIGCVAGALEEGEYRGSWRTPASATVDIEPTRIYRAEDARAFLASAGLDDEGLAESVDGRFMSAFVRATKPGRRGPVLRTRLLLVEPLEALLTIRQRLLLE